MDESIEKPSCFDPEVWIPYVRSPAYLAFRLFSAHSTLAIAVTHRLTEIVLAGGDEDENADEFDLPDEYTVTCKIEFGRYLRRAYTTDCDGGGSESCDLVAVLAAVAGKPPLPDHRHLVIEISDDEDEDNDGAAEAAEDSDESDVDTEEGDIDQIRVLKRVYEDLNELRKRVKTAVVAQSRVEGASVAAVYVAILTSAACSVSGKLCGCDGCAGRVFRSHTTKCGGASQHDVCPDAYLRSLFAAIDGGQLQPTTCPVDPDACVFRVPDPEVACYEHPDQFSARVRSLIEHHTGYDDPRASEEVVARYTEKYIQLYKAWEGETRETRSTVETHLRTIADHYHTPCCHTPYFYDACSAVRCARCAVSFCAICHKMYFSDGECHNHVWLCIRSHADTSNTVPRPNDVFVSEATRDKYFVATRVRMICRYAYTPDRSILGVGGIVRWNNLVQSVLRAMLCSGNPNQRLVDALGITDTMLSPFCV